MGGKKASKRLGIVGGGPRGLSALESVYNALAQKKLKSTLFTVLFEPCEHPGAGEIYNLYQPDTNWLNVSERGLTIPAREEIKFEDLLIPAFASYHDWSGYVDDEDYPTTPDKFPLRSKLGRYLHERYLSIATVLINRKFLTIIKSEVIRTDWTRKQFEILDKNGHIHHTDELVLTIGHQPTRNDEQISSWLYYAADKISSNLITQPYPVANFLKEVIINPKNTVAIRGFGLAMIDVMRALTTGLGGEFKVIDEATQKMTYDKSGKDPAHIVPFSLDGLPMAPKPLNQLIDEWFYPTDLEKENFRTELKLVSNRGVASDISFLIEAIKPIVSRVFIDLESKAYPHNLNEIQLQYVINSWLLEENTKHDLILSKCDGVEKNLKAFVGMATATAAISLDFCIGHVWRHCQPTIYDALSYSNLDDNVIALIVQLDERLKRYSYGPPVHSLQQILALVKTGIINLDYIQDPKIDAKDNGWEFSNEDELTVVNLIINSVLDSPKILEVNSPIIRHLLNDSLIKPIHNELGTETSENGCVLSPSSPDFIPLAILGRLSKGTIIGVDAILECFGSRSEIWGKSLIERW